MAEITMLDKVKLALRISTTAYDGELTDLIAAAIDDLKMAGITPNVTMIPEQSPLVCRAVITYCKFHFGEPADPERIKKSYDEQKAQMMTASGYTRYNRGQK